MYKRSMVKKIKILKLLVFAAVLLGITFPAKAPVSSAKSKQCCQGHCLMSPSSANEMSGKHHSGGNKMISCCQNNCLSATERKVLSPRAKHASLKVAILTSPLSALTLSVVSAFFNGPPAPQLRACSSGSCYNERPIFQVNSNFLI